MQKLKLALTGESLRIRSFRGDRGHSTAWPLLSERDPAGRRYDYAPGPYACSRSAPLEGDRRSCSDRVPPEQTEGQISDYTKLGSSPGGGRPTFTRCRRIFLTSSRSVITAITFMGEWQRGYAGGAPGRVTLVHLSDEPCPCGATFLIRHSCFDVLRLYRFICL